MPYTHIRTTLCQDSDSTRFGMTISSVYSLASISICLFWERYPTLFLQIDEDQMEYSHEIDDRIEITCPRECTELRVPEIVPCY
jgi:hypothetical protein